MKSEVKGLINQKRILTDFLDLVRIDSPTGSERLIADNLKKQLENLKLEVIEDKAGNNIGGNSGNIIGNLKGNISDAPTLLLSAHMDCVPPCQNVEPILEDGVIRSAGSTVLGADDKSGIVAIMEALRTVTENNIPHGNIQVIFNIAEEGGLNGSRYLDRSLLKADLGFVLDSSGKPGEIILQAPGQDSLKVTIHGKAAHAGIAPEEGISATVAAAKALSVMRLGRIDEETTANIGTIQGGVVTNIVTERIDMRCESRSRNLFKLQEQTNHMCNTFKRCAEEMGARAEIEVLRVYEPYVLTEDSLVAQIASKSANQAVLTPKFKATGGGSDANFYNRYGVSCAVLGTGMQKVHTTEECIEKQDLFDLARLIVEIIKTTAATKK